MSAALTLWRRQARTCAEPFDSIAPTYDSIFMTSAIGRARRSQVAVEINRCFQPGGHILPDSVRHAG